jgi:hypothetical protein
MPSWLHIEVVTPTHKGLPFNRVVPPRVYAVGIVSFWKVGSRNGPWFRRRRGRGYFPSLHVDYRGLLTVDVTASCGQHAAFVPIGLTKRGRCELCGLWARRRLLPPQPLHNFHPFFTLLYTTTRFLLHEYRSLITTLDAVEYRVQSIYVHHGRPTTWTTT